MKRDITLGEIVEGMARKINPEAWRVMDGYLAETERKYRGQNAAWPADQFKHKESLAVASATLTALLTTANITEAQLIALARGEAVVVPKEHPEAGDWFYLGDDTESDHCRFSVHEVIDDDVRGDGVFPISRAKELPQVYAAVHYLTEEERALRDDDEAEIYSVHTTKEEADAAYSAMLAALKARP